MRGECAAAPVIEALPVTAKRLVLDEGGVATRVVEADLIARTHRLRTQDIRLALIGILHAAWNAYLNCKRCTGHRILYGSETILDHIADCDCSSLAGDFEVNRSHGWLLDLADDGGEHGKPASARLPRENLTERMHLLGRHGRIEEGLYCPL